MDEQILEVPVPRRARNLRIEAQDVAVSQPSMRTQAGVQASSTGSHFAVGAQMQLQAASVATPGANQKDAAAEGAQSPGEDPQEVISHAASAATCKVERQHDVTNEQSATNMDGDDTPLAEVHQAVKKPREEEPVEPQHARTTRIEFRAGMADVLGSMALPMAPARERQHHLAMLAAAQRQTVTSGIQAERAASQHGPAVISGNINAAALRATIPTPCAVASAGQDQPSGHVVEVTYAEDIEPLKGHGNKQAETALCAQTLSRRNACVASPARPDSAQENAPASANMQHPLDQPTPAAKTLRSRVPQRFLAVSAGLQDSLPSCVNPAIGCISRFHIQQHTSGS